MRKTSLIASLIFFTIMLVSCSAPLNFDHPIGFGLASKADALFWAKQLNAQWYYDWSTKNIPVNKQLEYWQTIRVNQNGYSPSKENIIQITKHHKGYTWIIGNEPDNQHQDNTTPEKYAELYHELYYLIKKSDKKAKIAIGGVSQATPIRMAYLDEVLKTYEQLYHEKMPVDWWNVHGYVLREEKDAWGVGLPVGITSEEGILYDIEHHGAIDTFQNNIIGFRKWMKVNGYQETPLVVTEFGILFGDELGYSDEIIADYLSQTCTWLLTYRDQQLGYSVDDFRLVQKFAWFSLSDPNFPAANLANLDNKTLTTVGEAFSLIYKVENSSSSQIP